MPWVGLSGVKAQHVNAQVCKAGDRHLETLPTKNTGKKARSKKKKWLHGAHAAYAANEPQANERTQRMEGKDCQNKPPLQKGL
jgi:hypothetical protein